VIQTIGGKKMPYHIKQKLKLFVPYLLHQPQRPFQTIEVRVTVPKGCTLSSLPMIFSEDQVLIVKTLARISRSRIEYGNTYDVWIFRYNGPNIFYEHRQNVAWPANHEKYFYMLGRMLKPSKEISVRILKETDQFNLEF
jgi:hypothetical protein